MNRRGGKIHCNKSGGAEEKREGTKKRGDNKEGCRFFGRMVSAKERKEHKKKTKRGFFTTGENGRFAHLIYIYIYIYRHETSSNQLNLSF